MRLLIPTTDTNGAGAWMSGHFARAPHYAVADTDLAGRQAEQDAQPALSYRPNRSNARTPTTSE